MRNNRERLLDDIVAEIKKKALTCYNYGGYIFYPNGDILKKTAYTQDLWLKSESLVAQGTVSTVTGAFTDKDKIDPYLLLDTLNNLKDVTKESTYGSWQAEGIVREETLDRYTAVKAADWANERAILLKYIRGIEFLSVSLETTDAFESYTKRLSAWCEIACSSTAEEDLKKLIANTRIKFKSSIERPRDPNGAELIGKKKS